MPRNSIVGAGGASLPIDMYLKKQQYTCMPEAEDAFEQYSRGVLKNMQGDAPLWEDEFVRRETQSAEKLNIYHVGKRSEKLPDLPDGTFLDWEFLEHDPRPSNNEPNWQELRDARNFRMKKYYKWRSDDDHTRAENAPTDSSIQRRIRRKFYEFANRLRVFSTSKENHQGPHRSVKFDQTHGSEKIEVNRMCLPVDDMMLRNRTHIAKELEDTVSTGWYSTTDHEFKIAYFAEDNRKQFSASAVDARQNRSSTEIDHELPRPAADNVVPRSVAIDVINLTRQKITGIQAMQGVDFGEEATTLQRHRKKIQEDVTRARRQTQRSAPCSIEEKGPHAQSGRKFVERFDPNVNSKSVFNPVLATAIVTGTRRLNHGDFDDLREQVKQSATENSIFVERTTQRSSAAAETTNASQYKVQEAQSKTESADTIPLYGSMPFSVLKTMMNQYKDYQFADDIDKGDARVNPKHGAGAQLVTMDRHTNADMEPSTPELGGTATNSHGRLHRSQDAYKTEYLPENILEL